MHYCSRYHLSNIVLENVVLTLDKLIMGAYRLHFFKKPRWPTLPHLVGQCGPPPFFKKGAPRGPSQNFFPGRLIAMQKCHITSIVQNFKYKVYEKNLKKCSQMAHITPPPPKFQWIRFLAFQWFQRMKSSEWDRIHDILAAQHKAQNVSCRERFNLNKPRRSINVSLNLL